MNAESQILEKWIGTLAAFQPENAAAVCQPKPDPFRNPGAHAIRQSLTQLWEELRGNMNSEAIDSALDTILRIRAVQDLSQNQAVSFVIQLRSILREAPATFDLALLERRIDRLALAAFDKYMQCREHLLAVRLRETERLTHPHRARKAGA